MSDAEHRDARTIVTGVVALTIGMGIWWNYFDMLGRRVPGQRGPRLANWLYAHLPLTMAIAAAGAATVNLVGHATETRGVGSRLVAPERLDRSDPRGDRRRVHRAPGRRVPSRHARVDLARTR